jgi:hypothetical protein
MTRVCRNGRVTGDNEQVGDNLVRLHRSGWADWQYDAVDLAEPSTWVLLPVAFLANVITHLLVFRGGWTISVSVGGQARALKTRYRSKARALADLERQRQLAAELPPVPPRKPLPTRGGSLRRPW